MDKRTLAAALAAAALLTLTACSSPEQGTAERATKATAADDKKADSGEDKAAEDEQEDEQPDTELSVGDAFRYTDGVKVTVSEISEITKYGEYDTRPGKDQTAFRVHWSVENGTKKPVSLDEWGYNATGATSGGEAEIFSVEPGSKFMTGRLAPGKSGSFTSEYALAKSDGKDVVFTMTRLGEEANFLAEDPNWTGTIK